MASKDKAVRNEFRRFMSKWPEKYDYTAAQVREKRDLVYGFLMFSQRRLC